MHRRALIVLLVAGAALVATASAADAHALVRSSDPANGAILSAPPSQVTVTFTEPPDPKRSHDPGRKPTQDPSRPWYECPYQGKEVVHTCMINMGPWRCAAAEAATSALTEGLPGGIQPLRRRHDG